MFCQNKADVYLESAATKRPRLVPLGTDPDGDIKIQWYSQDNADLSNRSRIRFLFSDPEQFRSRMYFCQNNADTYLEPGAACTHSVWIRMETSRSNGTVRIMLT